MNSELVTKNFIEKLSKDNFESFLYNLEEDMKSHVFEICSDLKLLRVGHFQKLIEERNLSYFKIPTILRTIPLLIKEGELKLSQDFIEEGYKKINEKNLLNHLTAISSMRKEFFSKDIDLAFNELSIYLANQDFSNSLEIYNEVMALLESNWRSVFHTKPQEFYNEKLKSLIDSVKDKSSAFFKIYCRTKKDLSNLERMQLLILASTNDNDLKEAMENLGLENESSSVVVKKINVKRIAENKVIDDLGDWNIDYKNIIQVNEDERKKIIQKYLDENQRENETNEVYVLSLIKEGHFDEIEKKSDLVMTFYEIGYEKAIETILERYKDQESKLTYAQLLLRDERLPEAKTIAAEVLTSNTDDLSLIEWANSLIDN